MTLERMIMLKFSASFTNINPNFVIQNIEDCNIVCNPIFNVLRNILQRGCPTIPSRLLKEKFGNINIGQEFQYRYNFLNCCCYILCGRRRNRKRRKRTKIERF